MNEFDDYCDCAITFAQNTLGCAGNPIGIDISTDALEEDDDEEEEEDEEEDGCPEDVVYIEEDGKCGFSRIALFLLYV